MIALMMLVISATSTWHGTEAFCPFKCHCDDQKMKVICTSEANLDIIPITLNPGIKEIHLRENQIRYVIGYANKDLRLFSKVLETLGVQL